MFRSTAVRALPASLAVAALCASAAAAETVAILHINDLHSRLEPISKYDGTCTADQDAEGECFGGVARMATIIKQRRDALQAAGTPVVVLDAGDQFQGSLMYMRYKGAAEVEFMNAIGFDAMAVGNHEFDDGPEGLGAFIDKAEFPVVSGNIDVSNEPALAGKVLSHVILDVGGAPLAVVSALAADTVETSSPGPNVLFSDEIASLKAKVAELEAQGITRIVALNHVGLPMDQRIAAAVPGLDAVIGGHSHTLLSNNPEAGAAGPYPVFVEGPSGTPVPVVQAYAYSKYVGLLELTFDDAGVVTQAKGDVILLDNAVARDADVAARVAELAGPIEELKSRVVANISEPIDGERGSCRSGECTMGNLVADAMLDRVKGQGVTIAIQNGGGLRASIAAGEVTMGDVLTVLPFQNTVATMQLTGADVIAALENGVSQVEESKGRFPQVSGLRYVWTRSAAPNAGRIQEVTVNEGGTWVPIDPAKTYGVVTNNYMRGGGDGYAVFRDNARNPYDHGPGLEAVVASYLGAADGYAPYLDGRVEER